MAKSIILFKIYMHHFMFPLVLIYYYFSWIQNGENVPFRRGLCL